MEKVFAGNRRKKRNTAIFAIVIIGLGALISVLALLSFAPSAVQGLAKPSPESLFSFENYAELQTYIASNAKSAQQYQSSGLFPGGVAIAGGPEIAFGTAEAPLATSTTPSFTGTNVQVQGVDEPDMVKTDGTHLFVASENNVTIINAYPPSSLAKLSTISVNGSIAGIEVQESSLMIISQTSSGATGFLLYNIANLSAPKLFDNITIPGNYVAARMAQGYVYAIIQEPSYQFHEYGEGNATGVLPTLSVNGINSTLPISSIYYTPNRALVSYYTMIASVNMNTGGENTVSVLTGPSSTVYVSLSNIYVVYSDYGNYYANADGIPGDVFTGGSFSSSGIQMDNSTIFRASYSNGSISVEAAGSIPGYVLNQFSMDEYDGYFRIATSGYENAAAGGTTMSDNVYVLNENMSELSSLQNIAPGENIYAVRFVGDIGYVVTFEQVDPLFAISFQNPAQPVILSALQVNGYSDYLQPLPGGYLIGVGKDSVPSSTGNYAYYLGLKLSLFKVNENGSSQDISNYMIGDRGTDSPVLTDHLAFTLDSSTNITVIPVLLAKVSGNQSSYQASSSPPLFGNYVWQGAYVLKVTDSGFTMLGNVTQYPSSQNYFNLQNNNLQIYRSVIIGNYLYTISLGEVMVSSLSSFSTVGVVML